MDFIIVASKTKAMSSCWAHKAHMGNLLFVRACVCVGRSLKLLILFTRHPNSEFDCLRHLRLWFWVLETRQVMQRLFHFIWYCGSTVLYLADLIHLIDYNYNLMEWKCLGSIHIHARYEFGFFYRFSGVFYGMVRTKKFSGPRNDCTGTASSVSFMNCQCLISNQM